MAGLLPSKPDIDPSDEPRVVGLDSDAADELIDALSSTTTRKVLAALHEEPASASELAERVDTSLQNVQYHLRKLEDAGLVEVGDTVYSEKGREMNVYTPADRALVVVAGREEETTGLKAALSRLLGGDRRARRRERPRRPARAARPLARVRRDRRGRWSRRRRQRWGGRTAGGRRRGSERRRGRRGDADRDADRDVDARPVDCDPTLDHDHDVGRRRRLRDRRGDHDHDRADRDHDAGGDRHGSGDHGRADRDRTGDAGGDDHADADPDRDADGDGDGDP
ncbi:ArsR/SmtB family transcription factor [Salinigranum sp. GCM10025319]|uniref:ArsR/SmtB family transcription factor n=1 Tax=Salinigranum sp. GCM10025319 TaxID=3252687 RepID=UPI003614462E